MKKNTVVAVCVILFTAVATPVIISIKKNPEENSKTLETLAKCLAEKNVVMYGADWCVHCKSQKKRFGSAWKYVPYVECPENLSLCLEKGIDGYPTWILPDGKKIAGDTELETLAEETDCPLPREEK